MATTTMALIGKQTVGANSASSVTFSNIPQTYTDLILFHSSRNDSSGTVSAILQINGNTTNIYSAKALGGNGEIGRAHV